MSNESAKLKQWREAISDPSVPAPNVYDSLPAGTLQHLLIVRNLNKELAEQRAAAAAAEAVDEKIQELKTCAEKVQNIEMAEAEDDNICKFKSDSASKMMLNTPINTGGKLESLFTKERLDAWFDSLQENRAPVEFLPPMSTANIQALNRIRRINEELAQQRIEEERARLAAEAEAENAVVAAVEKDVAVDDDDDIPVVKTVTSSQAAKMAPFVPSKKDADESLFTVFG